MRVSAYSYAMVTCVVCLLALLPAESATANSTAMPGSLIGTWRLVTIEYSGPVGPLPDPLFWPGSKGLIMYDRIGWMTVQIYAPNRPPAKGPPRTSGTKLSVEDAGLNAAGFDTYYAYLGTWEFDGPRIRHQPPCQIVPADGGNW
jgi:Lipocalin-like domain